MGVEVGDVYAKVSIKDDIDSGLSSIHSKFNSFGSQLESKAASIGNAVGGALKTGIIAGTAALAGIATVGVTSFMDLESSAADAASKTGAMGDEFVKVKQKVIDLSRDLGKLNTNSFDPNQIGKAMANLAAGGFDVASASAKDLAPILALATAANYDLDKSAEMATGTMNMFGKGVGDLGHISDMYVTAAGKSAAGMEDMNYAMQYAGPVAAGMGISMEKVTANIEAFSTITIKGEKAGTALRDGLNTLIAPSKASAEALDAMGISVASVDPRTHDFNQTLAMMKAKADASGEGMAAFNKVFGVTGGMLYQLAGMTPKVAEFQGQLENSAGAAERMARLMNDTLGASFNAAKGAAMDLAIGIGERLAPTLKAVFDWFGSTGAPAIQSFIDAVANGDWGSVGTKIQQGLSFAISTIGDLGGQLWAKISPAIESFKPKIFAAFTTIGAGIGAAMLGMGAINLAPILAGIVPAVAGMAASVVGSFAAMATGSVAALAPMVTEVATRFAAMASGALASLGTMAASVASRFSAMALGAISQVVTMTATTAGQWAMQNAVAVAAAMRMAGGVLAGYALMAEGAIYNFGIMATESAAKWGTMAAQSVAGAAKVAVGVLAGYASMALGAATSMAGMVTNTLAGFGRMALGAVTSAAGMAASVIGSFASMAAMALGPVALITAGVAALGLALTTDWGSVGNQLSGVFESAKKSLGEVWDLLQKGDYSGAAIKLKDAFASGAKWAYDEFKKIKWADVANTAFNALKAGFSKVTEIGSSILNTLRSVDWGSVASSIKSGLSSAFDYLKGLGGQVLDALKGVNWSSVGSTILSGIKTVVSGASGIGSDLLKSIQSVDWSSVGNTILDGIKSVLSGAAGLGSDLLNSIKNVDWSSAGDIIKAGISTGIEALSSIGQQIWGYLDSVQWDQIGLKAGTAIKDGLTALSGIGSQVMGYFTSANWSSAGGSVADSIKGGLSKLNDWYEEFKTGFISVDWAGAAGDIATKIKDAWKAITDWGSSIYDGLKTWIEGNDLNKLGKLAGSLLLKGIGAAIYIGAEAVTTIANALWTALTQAPKWIAIGIEAIGKFAQGFVQGALNTLVAGIELAILMGIQAGLNQIANNTHIPGLDKWASDQLSPIQTRINELQAGLTSLTETDYGLDVDYRGTGEVPSQQPTNIKVNVEYSSDGKVLGILGNEIAAPALETNPYGGLNTKWEPGTNNLLIKGLNGDMLSEAEFVKQMASAGFKWDLVTTELKSIDAANKASGNKNWVTRYTDDRLTELHQAYQEEYDKYVAAHQKVNENDKKTSEEIGTEDKKTAEEINSNNLDTANKVNQDTLTTSKTAAGTWEAAGVKVAGFADQFNYLGDKVAAPISQAMSSYVHGTREAANALTIGANVAATGFSNTVDAVTIRYDAATGRQVAMIGSVGESVKTKGTELMAVIDTTGVNYKVYSADAGKSITDAGAGFGTDVSTAGDGIISDGGTFGDNLITDGGTFGTNLKNDGTTTGKSLTDAGNTLADTLAGPNGIGAKITNALDIAVQGFSKMIDGAVLKIQKYDLSNAYNYANPLGGSSKTSSKTDTQSKSTVQASQVTVNANNVTTQADTAKTNASTATLTGTYSAVGGVSMGGFDDEWMNTPTAKNLKDVQYQKDLIEDERNKQDNDWLGPSNAATRGDMTDAEKKAFDKEHPGYAVYKGTTTPLYPEEAKQAQEAAQGTASSLTGLSDRLDYASGFIIKYNTGLDECVKSDEDLAGKADKLGMMFYPTVFNKVDQHAQAYSEAIAPLKAGVKISDDLNIANKSCISSSGRLPEIFEGMGFYGKTYIGTIQNASEMQSKLNAWSGTLSDTTSQNVIKLGSHGAALDEGKTKLVTLSTTHDDLTAKTKGSSSALGTHATTLDTSKSALDGWTLQVKAGTETVKGLGATVTAVTKKISKTEAEARGYSPAGGFNYDKILEGRDDYGMVSNTGYKNPDAFSEAVRQFTAGNDKFCEASSEFCLFQETVWHPFLDDYFGPIRSEDFASGQGAQLGSPLADASETAAQNDIRSSERASENTVQASRIVSQNMTLAERTASQINVDASKITAQNAINASFQSTGLWTVTTQQNNQATRETTLSNLAAQAQGTQQDILLRTQAVQSDNAATSAATIANNEGTRGAFDYGFGQVRNGADYHYNSVKGLITDHIDPALKADADSLNNAATNISSASDGLGQIATAIAMGYGPGNAPWGGDSINHQGWWIGTGSTMVNGGGYTNWGGTASSTAVHGGGGNSSVTMVNGTAVIGGGRRAEGGPVEAGKLYLVGENGPEPFIPATDGVILPNRSLARPVSPRSTSSVQNISISIELPVIFDGQEIKRLAVKLTPEIMKESKKRLQLKGVNI